MASTFFSNDNIELLLEENEEQEEEIEKLLKTPLLNSFGILPNRTYVWDEYLKAFSEGATEIVEAVATVKRIIMKYQQTISIAEQPGNTHIIASINSIRDELRSMRATYNQLKRIMRRGKYIVGKRKEIFLTYIERIKRHLEDTSQFRMEGIIGIWNRDMKDGKKELQVWGQEISEVSEEIDARIVSANTYKITFENWQHKMKKKLPSNINESELRAFQSIMDPVIEYLGIEIQEYTKLRDELGVLMERLIPTYMRPGRIQLRM